MENNELYEQNEGANNTTPVTVSKGPFFGLVLVIVGILFLISSLFAKSTKLNMTGTVTYASATKQENGIAYQQLKVSFNYNGRTYETDCKVTNGHYVKHDTIKFNLVNNDPTKISTDPGSSNKGVFVFFGLAFLAIGILLFLKIIDYEAIMSSVTGMFSSFKFPTNTPKKEKSEHASSGFSPLSVVTDFIDAIPKKDNDRTKDDTEERRKQKKASNKPEKKQKPIYTSDKDNILDLYEDEDEDED